MNDGKGGIGDFGYAYDRNPDGSGSFEFLTFEDIHDDVSMTLQEKLTVRSRWNTSGAGRADYEASEGNLSSAVTGNECWDTSFNSQYVNASWDSSQNYGVEATDCAFTSAEYSSL